ncbi:MAG TPA: HEXXH motif-containing putative peptide modification protein [Amycolatopsis sp.]|uniref:aKG-HExxH-type peptide beta-hydroxylase n=1 Tax=Amycolatopsis sp. TaxID=37632 RepID=UPI002B476EF5|nr:HEXXH motif-containing putative peptide modification protein [Amycolatopsis sp.]HKS47332.1 HEXXH motif-containing putative peptide modification protein [Amycolatopsis sp.]
MNRRSAWPDATAVHAALAPVGALLAERRALYRLAADMFASDEREPADEKLDNPLFRFRVGEALAGRALFDPTVEDDLAPVTTELRSGEARLRVAIGMGANDLLAGAMRVIRAQSFSDGTPPRLLTGADGEPFTRALDTIQAGLDKARAVSPQLTDDLLPHVGLLVILDPETSGGLISASSRFFPGLILIDRPVNPFDVAEALIHEGAHQKFFDLAITHDFLGADPAEGRTFHPSWSGASWPVEQVIAAFHAYACLAQFNEDVARAGESASLGVNSLLPVAREREEEIGEWLLAAETALELDARWLLRTFLEEDTADLTQESTAMAPEGRYALDPLLRVARMAHSRRVLLARPGSPPELHWLSGDAGDVVVRLSGESLSAAELGSEYVRALSALVESSLVHRVE